MLHCKMATQRAGIMLGHQEIQMTIVRKQCFSSYRQHEQHTERSCEHGRAGKQLISSSQRPHNSLKHPPTSFKCNNTNGMHMAQNGNWASIQTAGVSTHFVTLGSALASENTLSTMIHCEQGKATNIEALQQAWSNSDRSPNGNQQAAISPKTALPIPHIRHCRSANLHTRDPPIDRHLSHELMGDKCCGARHEVLYSPMKKSRK